MKKEGLIIIGLFIVVGILVYFFGGRSGYVKTGRLYISEIMASNSYTIKTENDDYPDYIELYNDNNYDINLQGYYLSDSMVETKKWAFPNITIKAHEYMLVFASGEDRCVDECHTNFSLSKDGETVTLLDKSGNIISRVTYPKLLNDTSFSFVNRDYQVTSPTPGRENSKERLKKLDIKDYKISINEYLTHNKGANYASDGGYYDFIELYNDGDKDVSLKGLSLSDNEDDLNKFLLPDTIIKAKDYLVIYLTDGKEIDGVYANFRLSDNDKKIILSLDEEIIDEVEIVKLDANISYGKKDDKWLYFMTPTPGMKNNTYGVESFGE